MADKNEFKLRKLELVNYYKEYIALLENLQVNDLQNNRKLNGLSNAHKKFIQCQQEFTDYLAQLTQQEQ